jgi:hypothetical protein
MPQDRGRDILGKIHENRSRASGSGNLKSLVDASRKFGNALNHHVPLGASTRNTNNVRFLEGVGTDGTSRYLSAENDQRRPVHQSVLERGHNVGGAGAGGDENDTGLPGSTSIALCHVSCTLFMSRKDEAKMFGVVDGVEYRQNSTARVTNFSQDTMSQSHFSADGYCGGTNRYASRSAAASSHERFLLRTFPRSCSSISVTQLQA